MTIQVKHVRAGVLVVADAGLRFGPGQVLEVEELTPQLERAISAGLLVRHGDHREDQAEAAAPDTDTTPDDSDVAQPQEAEESVVDLSKLRAAEAISTVETEDDPDRLKAHLAGEDRRTVIAALEKRLAEVEADDR